MPRPPLAICIPTYRRPRYLAQLLDALAAELRHLDEPLPIVVSDNASGDETGAVVAAAALPVELHTQPENVGPLENVRWLFANAPDVGHVWCLGDDDVPVPGAVAYVLDLLARHDPAWLHLPHRWVDADGREKDPSPVPVAVRVYPSPRDLYLAHGHRLAFLSASVVARDPLAAVAAAQPTGNSWAPFIWYYGAARVGAAPCVIADRLLVEGGVDISWADRESEILTRDFVGIYDAALAADVTPAEFAATADGFYAADAFADHWATRPYDELVAAVERFPHSVRLRTFLWRLAARDGRADLFPALDAAARAAGAGERAEAAVAAGEARFAAGDVVAAADLFAAALEELPTYATAWNDLAVARHALGRPGAADAVGLALLLDPRDEDARANQVAITGG